jgi:regulator of replication initiation timing
MASKQDLDPVNKEFESAETDLPLEEQLKQLREKLKRSKEERKKSEEELKKVELENEELKTQLAKRNAFGMPSNHESFVSGGRLSKTDMYSKSG